MFTITYKILEEYYKNCMEIVSKDDFCVDVAQRKFRHSLQVAGAGNYIIKHEKTFLNRSPEFIKLAQDAYLLHDVGRFKEIEKQYFDRQEDKEQIGFTNKYDHGILGAEALKQTKEYNDIRITLPIKHHGHLIEELYNDSEYQNISSEQLKKDIKEIIFLVRDADKIANLYMTMKEKVIIRDPFYANMDISSKKFPIAPKVLESFFSQHAVASKDVVNITDRLLFILAWIFDINYKTAFKFSSQTKCFDYLMGHLREYNEDSNLQKSIEDYFYENLNKKL